MHTSATKSNSSATPSGGTVPPESRVNSFDHVRWWVSNAKQVKCVENDVITSVNFSVSGKPTLESVDGSAAFWYCTLFGFEPYAYRGLEAGFRQRATYAVRQDKIIFVFESALLPGYHHIGDHITQHGDGVRDVVFDVDNVEWIIANAKKHGVKIVNEVQTESDEYGSIKFASIQTYGDTIHTVCERRGYRGFYWPGFRPLKFAEELLSSLPKVGLNFIDHCVGNQPAMQMESAVEWYEKVLFFHRFWSVDDSVIHTEYSALKSIVVTNEEETVKMPINEPAKGKKAVSQIQEYVDYYGGAGVQHIALNTADIITAIRALRRRGVEFLTIPDSYYDNLRKRLSEAGLKVDEDLDVLQELKILVDFDEKGYLLQIFSKPCQDRPTFFIEIIQRHNHQGFGAGNFKALFESIELEQNARGNLFYKDITVGGKRIGDKD